MRAKSVVVLALLFVGSSWLVRSADAHSAFFDTNCASCHNNDARTCNGCHRHGDVRSVTLDSDTYNVASTMTVTIGGPTGQDSGWARVILYDHAGQELARRSGPTGTGNDGGTTTPLVYPYVFLVLAPTQPGTYQYEAAMYGSPFGVGGGQAYPHTVQSPRIKSATFTVTGQGITTPILAATIENLAVSPRLRDELTTDVYDIKATGLDVVGVNKRVYLEPKPEVDLPSTVTITDFTWSVVAEPSAGAAVIDVNTPALFKFHPSVAGDYRIRLQPTLSQGTAEPAEIRIAAAKFVGTGTEGANTPSVANGNCGVAFCHGDNAPTTDLNKVTDWNKTRHAHKLEAHLKGVYGASYRTSCLECHTVGYDELISSGNDNFREVAQAQTFNLDILTTWVADTKAGGPEHWSDLPAPLQLKSNIQCESCHGPGSRHSGVQANIVGALFDAKSCRQCHDSRSGHQQKLYQYDSSNHAISNLAGHGGSCDGCHTAEGFKYLTVDGLSALPEGVHGENPVNCVGCHDMHPEELHEHQVRTEAPATLPNGSVYDGGLGNLCANCHNSRIAKFTASTSYRGSHYGPQSDVILGKTAYDWDKPYSSAQTSIHVLVTTDTCVSCHMAPGPEGAFAPQVGDHTYRINSEDGQSSNVARACGISGCHVGLTTTDRIVPYDLVDYNGDGFTSGVQTEVGGLLGIVRNEILSRYPGVTYDPGHRKINISNVNYVRLPFDQKAALFNFNLISMEGSQGVHNRKYAAAVLQRTYRYVTGTPFGVMFPNATLVEGPSTAVRPAIWRHYR